jgi:hypothetical protein
MNWVERHMNWTTILVPIVFLRIGILYYLYFLFHFPHTPV